MKKILFITPYIPYPLDSGGNQAFFNMVNYIRQFMSVSIILYPHTSQQRKNIKLLKGIWQNVTFYIFEEQIPKVKNPLYYKILNKVEKSATRKIKRQNKTETEKAKQQTVLFESTYNRLSTQYLEYVAAISRKGFDFIQVEFYELISLGYILPPEVETIFVHHEIRYIRNKNELNLFSHQTVLDQMYFQIAKNYEHDALKTYKHIITLTDIDKEILKNFIGSNNIYTSPAAIQIPDDKKMQFTPIKTCRLTFTGSGLHMPNKDAIKWFIKEIYPILKQKNFLFTLDIIGAWDKKSIKEIEHIPNIHMIGFVDNLHHYLNGSINIVPIRIGSGMRIKILDSIIAYAPLITTTKGVEGIKLHHKSECLIADTPEEFASAIIELSKDIKLQQQLSEQAFKCLQESYNPQKLFTTRMNIYQTISLSHQHFD